MGFYKHEVIAFGDRRIRVQSHENKITHVWIDLTPGQWVDLLNTEGRWLSSCCSDISHARDLLATALRHNGQMDAYDFRDLVTTLADHDGFEELRSPTADAWTEASARWRACEPESPFLVIGDFWFAVQDRLGERRDEIEPISPDDPRRALSLLTREALAVECALMVHGGGAERLCHKAQIALAVARLIPALGVLHRHLRELAPGPFEGLAVVLRGTEQVVGTPEGPMIFATQSTLPLHVRSSIEKSPGKFVLRRCRVSLEEGILLGEEVTLAVEPPDRTALVARLNEARAHLVETTEDIERGKKLVGRAERHLSDNTESVRQAEEALRAYDIAVSALS